jgi:hypothetical protein
MHASIFFFHLGRCKQLGVGTPRSGSGHGYFEDEGTMKSHFWKKGKEELKKDGSP